ncbi:cytochrome P450 [Actinoplanes sp. NPDC026619]|uniref:cytochrome P450 n=1 Tax=Actinoplanes sp. NPDC026619 TaxID=3155798 RepID=UPI0033FB0891
MTALPLGQRSPGAPMRLDPFNDSYIRDPACTWRHLYGAGQLVSWDADLAAWVIAGHDNVRTVLSDTSRFGMSPPLSPLCSLSPSADEDLTGIDAAIVEIAADTSAQRRTRAILHSLFGTTALRAQEQWGDLIEGRIGELVTELAGQPDSDLMTFATRLSVRVMLDILGLPTSDADDLRVWIADLADLMWGNPDPSAQLAGVRSRVKLRRYCELAVTERLADGDHGSGLIGDMLRYRDGDDATLTVAEIAALTFNLVAAGGETTGAALGHALRHGLADPGRWAHLTDDHYLALHVEESLRHSPAIDGWLRVTTTDVTVDGIAIPAGSRCLVLIGAANHDPEVYDDAQLFDPRRPRAGQHLGFGAGPHRCIGAAVARLLLATALRTLAQRLPDLALTDAQIRFRPNAVLRIPTALPVRTTRCPVAHPASSGSSS